MRTFLSNLLLFEVVSVGSFVGLALLGIVPMSHENAIQAAFAGLAMAIMRGVVYRQTESKGEEQ